MYVTAGAGREVRLRVSEALVREFHAVRARFERVAAPGASFVAFLALSVWDAWGPTLTRMGGKWRHVYLRDGYRCQNPVCSRRDVTPHHLRFVSQGGGDEDDNVVSLCAWCHLEGIHGGRLRAAPPASAIDWTIGREPIAVVHGRARVAL
jgi:hypothetical protein